MHISYEKRKNIYESIKTIVITMLIVFFIKIFLFDATIVSGDSMNNTLVDNDLLMVDKITPRLEGYERGDIVIVRAPFETNKLFVKRIIGMPGDSVDLIDGSFYINGHILDEDYTNNDYTYISADDGRSHWQLGDSEYFIVGDNRIEGVSYDSRAFGPLSRDNFVGHVRFRIYPFDRITGLD